MRYMLVWSGLARSGGSAPRDLWQPDSAFRKPTQLYPSGRAKTGGKEREKERRDRATLSRPRLSASA